MFYYQNKKGKPGPKPHPASKAKYSCIDCMSYEKKHIIILE